MQNSAVSVAQQLKVHTDMLEYPVFFLPKGNTMIARSLATRMSFRVSSILPAETASGTSHVSVSSLRHFQESLAFVPQRCLRSAHFPRRAMGRHSLSAGQLDNHCPVPPLHSPHLKEVSHGPRHWNHGAGKSAAGR